MGKAQAIAVGVTLMGVAVLGYGLYRAGTVYWDFGNASGEMDAAVAAYHADGLPYEARDLATHVDPDQNAASAIQAALQALPRKNAKARLDAALKAPEKTGDAVVVDYGPALALLQLAEDRPRVDFRRDWDLGPNVLFPEYAGMKTLAKAAVLRADREAARGDDASALRDLGLARQTALWAGQEPTLISMLVQISGESIAIDGAERCLVHAADRPERIARYARWLKAAPPLPDFGRALRGEAWMGIAAIRNLDALGGLNNLSQMQAGEGEIPKIDPRALRRTGPPEGVHARGFFVRHLQLWDRIYRRTDRFRQPPAKIGAHIDAVGNGLESKKGLSYVVERILLPVFSQAGTAVVQLEARRAVRAGFAEALTTHALTGRWPTRVSGIDPFTGGPLRVKRTAKDFRVYSVGRDGKDDGGLLRREAPKRSDATFDEVAVYPPVPR